MAKQSINLGSSANDGTGTTLRAGGDLVNDKFEIQGINDRFGIRIFNRWGNLLYEEKPYLNQWDGINNNGSLLNNGTYYYILTNEIDEVKRNGSFILVK